jgi:hypothetical protein
VRITSVTGRITASASVDWFPDNQTRKLELVIPRTTMTDWSVHSGQSREGSGIPRLRRPRLRSLTLCSFGLGTTPAGEVRGLSFKLSRVTLGASAQSARAGIR